MCGRALIYGGDGGKKPTNERYIFEIEGLGFGILDSMATTSLPASVSSHGREESALTSLGGGVCCGDPLLMAVAGTRVPVVAPDQRFCSTAAAPPPISPETHVVSPGTWSFSAWGGDAVSVAPEGEADAVCWYAGGAPSA